MWLLSMKPRSYLLATCYFGSNILCILLLSCGSTEGVIKLPENLRNMGAVFAFGDSIVDQGANNVIKTIVKADFPPYGKDFEGGVPTGRFGNGKTPPDLVAEELGITDLIPAYLDPNLKPEDLKKGVSFASGGSGYDPQTPALASAIPLSDQLKQFKEYIEKLKGVVGEEEANNVLTTSLYLLVTGTDDIANTYYTIGLRRLQYDVPSYADLMTSSASNFIQEIYKLGARRIAFFGLPPIGCVPIRRTLGGGPLRVCEEKSNKAAQIVNAKFSSRADLLSQKLPGSSIVYIDIYYPLLNLIQNPQRYGFEVVNKGCCGTGLLEVVILCNKFSKTCPDDTKYIFWDSYHPTEKAYKILVDQVLTKYVNRFL